MRPYDSTYEGWTNYETWAVHLWLSNDEGSYYAARETVADNLPADVAHMAMRELVEQSIFGDEAPATLATDLLNHSLARVDWAEVVAAFVECNASDADECRMDCERSVAGISDRIPECLAHPAVGS